MKNLKKFMVAVAAIAMIASSVVPVSAFADEPVVDGYTENAPDFGPTDNTYAYLANEISDVVLPANTVIKIKAPNGNVVTYDKTDENGDAMFLFVNPANGTYYITYGDVSIPFTVVNFDTDHIIKAQASDIKSSVDPADVPVDDPASEDTTPAADDDPVATYWFDSDEIADFLPANTQVNIVDKYNNVLSSGTTDANGKTVFYFYNEIIGQTYYVMFNNIKYPFTVSSTDGTVIAVPAKNNISVNKYCTYTNMDLTDDIPQLPNSRIEIKSLDVEDLYAERLTDDNGIMGMLGIMPGKYTITNYFADGFKRTNAFIVNEDGSVQKDVYLNGTVAERALVNINSYDLTLTTVNPYAEVRIYDDKFNLVEKKNADANGVFIFNNEKNAEGKFYLRVIGDSEFKSDDLYPFNMSYTMGVGPTALDDYISIEGTGIVDCPVIDKPVIDKPVKDIPVVNDHKGSDNNKDSAKGNNSKAPDVVQNVTVNTGSNNVSTDSTPVVNTTKTPTAADMSSNPKTGIDSSIIKLSVLAILVAASGLITLKLALLGKKKS